MQDDARKKEDGGLETEEKTKGTMQVETDTDQTVYTQVEPDTGQTACTLRRQKTGSVMQVETDTGQTVYTQVEPETGQTAYIQVEPDTGKTAYTSPTVPMPSSEEDGRTDRAVARQTEEERPLLSDHLELSPIKTSLSMLQLEDAVDKLLLVLQYRDYRVKPETEEEPLEKTDSASYVPQSCKGEPLTKPDMEIHKEACPSDYTKNSVSEAAHDDVPTRRYRKGKAEANAKAGATRHLPSNPDDVESVTEVTNAKAGATRHSPRDPDRATKTCAKEVKRRQRDGLPGENCTRRSDKTCIWIEYRQHRLSVLLDTGSYVSIAGEKLARELGWTIRAHDTEAVGVANNKTMTILGAARVELIVAGHSVESEILIAPDFDGLLLGINWLRSQGRFRWDFDKGRIKFGNQDWIKLREEIERPPPANISWKNSFIPEYEVSIDETDFHVAPTASARKFCRSRLNRKFFRELALFCRAMNMVEIGREQGRSRNPEFDQRISNVRERVRTDVLATLSQHSPCAADAWARYVIVRNAKRTLLTLLCSHLSSSGVASPEEGTDTEEDAVELEQPQELQDNEGKTPEMSSVT